MTPVCGCLLFRAFFGIRIVKAYGLVTIEDEKFRKSSKKLVRYFLRTVLASEILGPIIELISSFGIVAAFLYAFVTKMPWETFIVIAVGLTRLYIPIKKLSKVHVTLESAGAAVDRIFAVMEVKPSVVEKPGARVLGTARESIEFEHVSFRYDSTVVLEDIHLTVPAGQIIAIVGTSGVALVSQEVILFNDTVANNIGVGKHGASREEITEAATRAYAHEFITQMPNGYDSDIGERGVRLSGGQRQRLAIARAILKNAPILILDEATSSLDSESERAVQQALDELMQKRTCFVIAHRLSTVQHADLILVIEQGRIGESGRHDELLARGGIYKRLHDMQFQE